MRLRKPCEHKSDAYPDGHYEPHLISLLFSAEGVPDRTDCPGGEFLPEGALVIQRDAEGAWWDLDESAILEVERFTQDELSPAVAYVLARYFDALASQVGEPEC